VSGLGASMETEDEWADRMWREMQDKRRAKAAEDSREWGLAPMAPTSGGYKAPHGTWYMVPHVSGHPTTGWG